MNKIQQSISLNELFYLVVTFLLGSSVIFLPGSQAKNDAWFSVVLGILEGFIFLAIYAGLAKQHRGKNLVQINTLVFGRLLGKIISWLYSLYFLYISALLLRTFASFFSVIMTETPLVVFLITPLFISAFAVRSGLETIAKYSQLILVISSFLFIFDTILLFHEMNFANLLPFFDLPATKILWAAHTVGALPFGQAIVFLMFINLIHDPEKKFHLLMQKSFLYAGTFLVIYVIRTTAVLGQYATISTYPNFAALRIINVGSILTRLEIISAITFLTLGFVKGSIFYYGGVLGIAQLLEIDSYKPLVLPLGALLLNISYLVYEEYIFDLIDANTLFPLYSMIFALFLPLLTLFLAKIRKTGPKQEV